MLLVSFQSPLREIIMAKEKTPSFVQSFNLQGIQNLSGSEVLDFLFIFKALIFSTILYLSLILCLFFDNSHNIICLIIRRNKCITNFCLYLERDSEVG